MPSILGEQIKMLGTVTCIGRFHTGDEAWFAAHRGAYCDDLAGLLVLGPFQLDPCVWAWFAKAIQLMDGGGLYIN
ncbi:hypothetical protein APSETT445_003041 [Aspergillus pseudonomiae]